jgi:hypothetical protein
MALYPLSEYHRGESATSLGGSDKGSNGNEAEGSLFVGVRNLTIKWNWNDLQKKQAREEMVLLKAT